MASPEYKLYLRPWRPARCNLRAAACNILCRRPQHRPQHVNCSAKAAWIFVCVRENTQHACKIAESSVALLMKIQRKLKYVQLGAACGLRPAAKYKPALKVFKQYSNHTVLLLQLFKIVGRLKPQKPCRRYADAYGLCSYID